MSLVYTVSEPMSLPGIRTDGLRITGSEYTGPPFDAYYERYGLNSSTAPYPW